MKKIEFDAKSILTPLSHVAAVVSQKNSMPILDCVKLETKSVNGDTILTMTASDAETWISESINVQGDTDINVCVDASDLLKGLRNLGDTLIVLEINEEESSITCKYSNGYFKLTCNVSSDFPICKTINDESEKIFNVDAKTLMYNISSVLFAANSEDTLRPALSCVHVDIIENKETIFVATDGQLLAKIQDYNLKIGNQEILCFNLPYKPTNLLLNILSSCNGNVSFKFNDKAIKFYDDMFSIETRLSETRYPNYNSVIPNEYKVKATFQKQELANAIKRVSPMGNITSELLKLTFGKNEVTASAENIDFCKKGQETINCKYDGNTISIGFKSSYLLQSLQNINSQEIEMQIIDETRAVILKPCTKAENIESIYLLMPLLLD